MRDGLLLKKFPLKRAVMLEVCSCLLQTRRQETGRVSKTLTTFLPFFASTKTAEAAAVEAAQPWTPTLSLFSPAAAAWRCHPAHKQLSQFRLINIHHCQLMVKIILFCKQARNMVLAQVLLFLLTCLKILRLLPAIRTPAIPAVIMIKTRQVLNWPSKTYCLSYSLTEPEGILFKIFLHPAIQQKNI